VLNALRVFGMIGLIVFFLVIIIVVNIRKKRESQMSILLRIFTNYLQLIATALSFDFKYPSFIIDTFYIVDRVGTSSESFLSFD
jgi:hypothetical protein